MASEPVERPEPEGDSVLGTTSIPETNDPSSVDSGEATSDGAPWMLLVSASDAESSGPAVSELLVLGMGVSNALPPREVRQAFLAAGLGLEFLDTPAAARLYNLLTSEGRRVAAALIAV